MNENYLNQYIDELNQSISSNFKLIEFEFLNGYYGDTRLNPVRDEICKCIICNLGQAALTLTNHLLELALKTCLIRRDLKRNKNFLLRLKNIFAPSIKKYGTKDMWQTISYAFKFGLITVEEKVKLENYKNKFRNAWGHADPYGMFGDKKITGKKVSFSKEDDIEAFLKNAFSEEDKEEYEIKEFLPAQGIIQAQLANELCVSYFKDVDKIIRAMLQKI